MKVLLALLTAFVAPKTNTEGVACFYQTRETFGNKLKGTERNDKNTLMQLAGFTPKHRLSKIDYCWNAYSSVQELTGLRVTIGVWNDPTSQIELNTFGKLSGTCSAWVAEKDEVITDI